MFTNLINASELANMLHLQNTVIIDCRSFLADPAGGRKAYEESHIPNAVHAHLEEDLSGEIIAGKTGRHPFPEVAAFTTTLSNWGISNDTQVIAYDQGHGGIAARLWFMLKWLGHKNVAVLNGGWENWQKLKMPTSQTIPPTKTGVYLPRPNPNLLVGIEDIEKNLVSNDYLVLDARAAARYRGEMEPIDPVAGHIPNAISAPFSENLAENGLFKSKEQLTERFTHLVNDQAIDKTIIYCGSGVTACHNLLALDYVGLEGAKLFPGSWSEWVTNIRRPIAITRSES